MRDFLRDYVRFGFVLYVAIAAMAVYRLFVEIPQLLQALTASVPGTPEAFPGEHRLPVLRPLKLVAWNVFTLAGGVFVFSYRRLASWLKVVCSAVLVALAVWAFTLSVEHSRLWKLERVHLERTRAA